MKKTFIFDLTAFLIGLQHKTKETKKKEKFDVEELKRFLNDL